MDLPGARTTNAEFMKAIKTHSGLQDGGIYASNAIRITRVQENICGRYGVYCWERSREYPRANVPAERNISYYGTKYTGAVVDESFTGAIPVST